MAQRKKKVIVTGVSREEAEGFFNVYARAEAMSQKLTAEMELKISKIRETYASRLSELEDVKAEAFSSLQSFAMENQAELFTKKKSLEMTYGVIGFRTGTPKLKTLKGFTWASALQLVKEFLPKYVRRSEEIAKDKLLADRDVKLGDEGAGNDGMPMSELMAKCGIRVDQDETFYVEPKKEEAQA